MTSRYPLKVPPTISLVCDQGGKVCYLLGIRHLKIHPSHKLYH